MVRLGLGVRLGLAALRYARVRGGIKHYLVRDTTQRVSPRP